MTNMTNTWLLKTQFTPGQLLDRLRTLYPDCTLDLDGGRVLRRQRFHWLLAGLVAAFVAGIAAVLLLAILDAAAPLSRWVITSTLSVFGAFGVIGWLISAVRRPLVAYPNLRVHREGREIWICWIISPPPLLREIVEFERLKAALAPRRTH